MKKMNEGLPMKFEVWRKYCTEQKVDLRREMEIARIYIDQEMRGTKDYKRLAASLRKCGLLRRGERVTAIEYGVSPSDQQVLRVFVGKEKITVDRASLNALTFV